MEAHIYRVKIQVMPKMCSKRLWLVCVMKLPKLQTLEEETMKIETSVKDLYA
jgi:hypothetical protein